MLQRDRIHGYMHFTSFFWQIRFWLSSTQSQLHSLQLLFDWIRYLVWGARIKMFTLGVEVS